MASKRRPHPFIQFSLDNGALLFGDFTLKSGRKSPYFFNAGKFIDGSAFAKLGEYYADAIVENFKEQYDVLFGPAYKGIQLATIASIGLDKKGYSKIPVCYNRKEAKDHGERGTLVGASLKDKRVLLIDDVITAGTAVRHSTQLIEEAGGKLVGVIVALDRQERGLESRRSSIQEIEQTFNIKVASIINLNNLIEFLQNDKASEPLLHTYLKRITQYQEEYGI